MHTKGGHEQLSSNRVRWPDLLLSISMSMVDWGSERWVSGISAHRFRNNATKVRFLLRALFLVHRILSSHCNLTWQKGRGGSMGLFQKGTNLIMRNLPSWPNHLPNALPPKIITLGFGFNITIGVGWVGAQILSLQQFLTWELCHWRNRDRRAIGGKNKCVW